MTLGKLETTLPMTLDTSLIEGDESASSSVQDLFKPATFSVVSIVIVIEFITNPRIVITCVGMKTDLSGRT